MDKRITMKKFKLTGILSFIFCLNSISIFAQDPTFDDDVVDVPAAPIDNWIPLLLLAAVIIAYRITSKNILKNK